MMNENELPLVTEKTVWDLLSRRQSIAPLLDRFPVDEVARIKQIEAGLRLKFSEVEHHVLVDLDAIDRSFPPEDQLLQAETSIYPSILKAMMTGSNYADLIWKEVEPHESACC